MGSGKSKTGEALARIFHYSFMDTDSLVEAREKKSVSGIFRENGEDYFRIAETEVLHELEPVKNVVIATGGGLPCFHGNMEWMNSQGITVYLEANDGLLFHRLVRSKEGRPLIENLSDVELMEQISMNIVVRKPFYKKAMITVGAANLDVKSLAQTIKKYKAV